MSVLKSILSILNYIGIISIIIISVQILVPVIKGNGHTDPHVSFIVAIICVSALVSVVKNLQCVK